MPSCTHTRSLFASLTPIFDKYWLSEYVGEGSYGRVFIAVDCHTNEEVALKTECGTIRTRSEYQIYRQLGHIQGLPRCHAAYTHRDHGVIVLERLGVNLQGFLRSSGGVVPIETVCLIGRAMVCTLRAIHDKGYLHRDVKPDNIMLPMTGELRPYLVDFGHATQRRHRPRKTSGAVGTLPFMSIHVHNGMPYDRRDDLVSLAYTLIYLACGNLPWDRSKDVKECIKQKHSFRPLQFEPSLPSTLERFFIHAQNLDLDAEPDYLYLESQLG